MRLKALDLFCGAGGAGMGLYQAGFDVVGVDIVKQKNYPAFHDGDHAQHFEFIQADAMTFPLEGFDFIWASPLCQKHSALRHLHPEKDYECFIARTRERLVDWGGLYAIENVTKAPLINPVMYCGSMFGLRVRRHRIFECNVPLRRRLCHHDWYPRPIDVSGTGGRRIRRRINDHGGNTRKPRTIAEARQAIGIGWMTRYELSRAIPPAYSLYIAEQIMPAVLRHSQSRSTEALSR